MIKAKIADALRRAGRTFFQAAGAYLVFNPDKAATGKALAVGAAGAGIAAVWRMLDPAETKLATDPEPEPDVAITTAVPSRKSKAGTVTGQL